MSEAENKELAIATLREICSDKDAPKQAKASAARTLLELSGDIGKLQSEKNIKDNKALHEMSKSELDAEIAKLGAIAPPLDSPSAKRIRQRKIRLGKLKLEAKKLKSKRTNGSSPSAKYDF